MATATGLRGVRLSVSGLTYFFSEGPGRESINSQQLLLRVAGSFAGAP